jgi:hypothetical protein
MKRKDLDAAMSAARVFLERAECLVAEHDNYVELFNERTDIRKNPGYIPDPPDGRIAAAVKRASLELTYTLPSLRRPR